MQFAQGAAPNRRVSKNGPLVPRYVYEALRTHRAPKVKSKTVPEEANLKTGDASAAAAAGKLAGVDWPIALAGKMNKRFVASANSTFYAATQRSAIQLALAGKVPGVARIAKTAVQRGNAVIIGLQSTGEASGRVQADEDAHAEEGDREAAAAEEKLLADLEAEEEELEQQLQREPRGEVDNDGVEVAGGEQPFNAARASIAAFRSIRKRGGLSSRSVVRRMLISWIHKYVVLPPPPQALLRRYGQEHLIPAGYDEVEAIAELRTLYLENSGDMSGINPLQFTRAPQPSAMRHHDDRATGRNKARVDPVVIAEQKPHAVPNDSKRLDANVDAKPDVQKVLPDDEPAALAAVRASGVVAYSNSDLPPPVATAAFSAEADGAAADGDGDEQDEQDPDVAAAEETASRAWEVMAALRCALIDAVEDLPLPPTPLDYLLYLLGGPSEVAEMTGRSHRIVEKGQDKKNRRRFRRNSSGSGSDSDSGADNAEVIVVSSDDERGAPQGARQVRGVAANESAVAAARRRLTRPAQAVIASDNDATEDEHAAGVAPAPAAAAVASVAPRRNLMRLVVSSSEDEDEAGSAAVKPVAAVPLPAAAVTPSFEVLEDDGNVGGAAVTPSVEVLGDDVGGVAVAPSGEVLERGAAVVRPRSVLSSDDEHTQIIEGSTSPPMQSPITPVVPNIRKPLAVAVAGGAAAVAVAEDTTPYGSLEDYVPQDEKGRFVRVRRE